MEATSQVGTSREGQLLVATPFLHDAPYRRAVVLLLRQSDRGSFGLVLNTQLPTELSQLSDFIRSQVTPDRLRQTGQTPWKLILGFVFWPPGNLERELERGIWMLTPPQLDPQVIYRDLWEGLLRQIGRSVLYETLPIDQFKVDASLN